MESTASTMKTLTDPPHANVKPTSIIQHGEVRTDNYAWLKDRNWQEVIREPSKLDPEILDYLKAENDYARSSLAATETLQKDLLLELRGRIKEDDADVPAKDGPYEYYTRFNIGGQHPIFCRRRNRNSPEEILLHGDNEAKGKPFFKVSTFSHSTDHTKLAYGVDLNGSERFELRVRDLATGIDIESWVENAKGDLAWANDGKTLYYTVLDGNHRPYQVARHTIGTDDNNDKVIYEERDPGFFVDIVKTQSGSFIKIIVHDHTTSEVHLIDADLLDVLPRLISPRKRKIEYDAVHVGEKIFILTNSDGAEDFKIMESSLDEPDRNNWVDVVHHKQGCLILTMLEFEDYLVRLERCNGLPRIVVRELSSKTEHTITFDQEAYELNLLSGHEFATNILRFTYSSLTTPCQTFDYNMHRRSRRKRKEQQVPSGHRVDDYITRRLLAPSHDGETIPVSLLYSKETNINGSTPVLLYGYGSYGMATPVSFSTNRFSLVDRGFIYAIAHVRGGTEKGYNWYLDGKLGRKKNSFLDFIAVAEHLISEKFTRPGQIAIHGASAGGLLIGACTNIRPDLWGAVIGEVPFVDVLTTISDADLPLTPPEWPEWGNPIKSKTSYQQIRSYSPVDNVVSQYYPPILVTAGLTDPRVTYWEPAKWVATLRANKTDDNPLYLRTNLEAGHGGAAGRFDRLEEIALIYAFLIQIMKIN